MRPEAQYTKNYIRTLSIIYSCIPFVIFAFATLIHTGAHPQAVGNQCDTGERIIRFNYVIPSKGNPKGEGIEELAQRVNTEMDGRYCMITYPAGELYTNLESIDALRDGELEMIAPPTSKLEVLSPEFRIFSLPFLFRNIRALEWFQNSGPGVRLKQLLKAQGFHGIAYWNEGFKQMSATRPLVQPEDWRGLRVRILASEVLLKVYGQLQAEPVQLPLREVRDALASGLIDGQENLWSNILGFGFYEYQDGITETNHGALSSLVMTSVSFWRSLPVEDRMQLQNIVFEVTLKVNQRATVAAQDARRQLEALGVTIRVPTEEQRAAWVAAMQPIWDEYVDDIGPELMRAAIAANR